MQVDLARFLHAPEDKGGSGGSQTPTPADKGGTDDGNPKDAGEKTFTQAELDATLKTRLERERTKYADYPTVKARLAELEQESEKRKQADMEQRGEYEKALEATKQRMTTELETVQGDRDTWKERYERLAIDNAVIVEAQRHNALDPNDVLALVRGRVQLGADGVPSFDDGKSVADGVKTFLDSKPHLVRAGSRGGSGTNHAGAGAPIPGAGKALHEQTVEEVRAQGGRAIINRAYGGAGQPPWARSRNKDKDNG